MSDSINLRALRADCNAVITGGANGIGLAVAGTLVGKGMNVAILDFDETALKTASSSLNKIADNSSQVLCLQCDVSDKDQIFNLASKIHEELGDVSFLMNNAGAGMQTGKPWENVDAWRKLIDVNLWGIIYSAQAFVPAMIESDHPGIVINTGSKQGITRPPSGWAYNMSKAGVIAYTEALAYEFRQIEGQPLSAHLLIPGFTYTGMISRFIDEKPDAAWTSEQVADFMFERLAKNDFYILCPDNDVSRQTDEKRIQWYADDLIKNRPALSRWHDDYLTEFERFVGGHKLD